MGFAFQVSVMLVFLACLVGIHSVTSAPLGDDNNKLIQNSASHVDSGSEVHADRLKRARDYDALSSFYKRSEYPESNADAARTFQDPPMYVMVPLPRKAQNIPVSAKEFEALDDVSKRFYKRFYKRGRMGNSRFYLDGGNEPFYLSNSKRGYQSSFY